MERDFLDNVFMQFGVLMIGATVFAYITSWILIGIKKIKNK